MGKRSNSALRQEADQTGKALDIEKLQQELKQQRIRRQGVIKCYDRQRGFGFVETGKEDLFFHIKDYQGGVPFPGVPVTYSEGYNKRRNTFYAAKVETVNSEAMSNEAISNEAMKQWKQRSSCYKW